MRQTILLDIRKSDAHWCTDEEMDCSQLCDVDRCLLFGSPLSKAQQACKILAGRTQGMINQLDNETDILGELPLTSPYMRGYILGVKTVKKYVMMFLQSKGSEAVYVCPNCGQRSNERCDLTLGEPDDHT
jgi:hypothetical protein